MCVRVIRLFWGGWGGGGAFQHHSTIFQFGEIKRSDNCISKLLPQFKSLNFTIIQIGPTVREHYAILARFTKQIT